MRIELALVLTLLAAPSWAQQTGVPELPPDAPVELLVDGLLIDFEAYDRTCQGGTGDDPNTFMACGARDYSGYLLGQLGWCLAPDESFAPCASGGTQLGRPDF